MTWILVLILWPPVAGFDRSYVLHQFRSERACWDAKDYVLTEMAKAYPNDAPMKLECRLQVEV